MSSVLLPGSTIGILGGGQLGRMLGVAARNLGYGVHVFEPAPQSPAGAIADLEVNESYENAEALLRFAQGVDVLTYEFENIPTLSLQPLEEKTALRPGRNILHVAQNRRREKEFLREHGIPIADFRIVESEQDLPKAVESLGVPCVLKTADFGYDGKGQQKLQKISDASEAWRKLGASCAVVEQWISYQAELSVIVARRGDGAMRCFPVTRNVHEHHILAISEVPAWLDPKIETQAQKLAQEIAQALEVVGLLAVEMFLTTEGKLLVNELAPRPHNSGHWTLDGCVTSQFEQHVRAICNLPLGETTILKPTLMRNLLGDLWGQGTPPWSQLLELPGLHLHLYGKTQARPGRKMGHYNIIAESLDQARLIDQHAQTFLNAKSSNPNSV